ncbi:30S ribosomal protein S6 [Helicobacter aurati]|uniref:Small ribosomal subunit protein bS6 n=1 Tax=Helicobacter aurati TaxID=137778 RepID=A0A3D8J015_9HELI|nr:30S ribosomal protein S6 [Helicobacter aurati]RDU70838.1 30S ribosomal protein S6 [Helicobacter aurati]
MSEQQAQERHYETMFIIKPTLVEEEIKAKIDFFKEVITKNNGMIETCLDMGMRTLAYEIKKNYRGYYFVIYFKAQPTLIKELTRLYRINEEILRFIVIYYKTKREQKAWQTLVDRANKKPEKQRTLKRDDVSKESTESSSPQSQLSDSNETDTSKEDTTKQ